MRNLVTACIVGVLVLVAMAAWSVFELPPPMLVLRYGLPPTGGPTGRRVEIEGVIFVELRPGYFRMGSHARCDGGDLRGRIGAVFGFTWGRPATHSSECPRHWVELRRAFWIAKAEVTTEQFRRFGAHLVRDRPVSLDPKPVTELLWDDARRYCEWLATRGPLEVRLPTESEWEFACRAGSEGEYCFGDAASRMGGYGWSRENSRGLIEAGAAWLANRWGLFDMHGNAGEWCCDRWHPNYDGAPLDGSAWTDVGSPDRVSRSGSAFDTWLDCGSARRRGTDQCRRLHLGGVRPAADPR
ncbi:MAG: formylglycine-generating enzyme family protein [Planctomycetes bacterium]|nr:formylglycine-generating enzyme family protein [Planctomycetota bacterium]